VPSVAVTSACVSPRVKSADPCVRGRTPTSIVAHDLFLQVLEHRLGVGASVRVGFIVAGDELVEHAVDRGVILELVLDAHRAREPLVRLRVHALLERSINRFRLERLLGLAGLFRQGVDAGDDVLDGLVRGVERLDHILFADFLRARFDHHDPVARARDREIQPAVAALLEGRIDDEAAVDEPDADPGQRA